MTLLLIVCLSVHPRVYGEYELLLEAAKLEAVHPRVYGEYVARLPKMLLAPRFTPVCTGNTCFTCKTPQFSHGSPPCVRGILRNFSQYGDAMRFTPVCTGNTCLLISSSRQHGRFTPVCTGNTPYGLVMLTPKPVHPRVYGEYR